MIAVGYVINIFLCVVIRVVNLNIIWKGVIYIFMFNKFNWSKNK